MSAFVEVNVKGNHRAYVEAASVAGVLLPKGADGDAIATDDSPMQLILKGGETMPGVFGISADELMLRCAGAREILRRNPGRLAVVVYLDRREEFYAELAKCMEERLGRAA